MQSGMTVRLEALPRISLEAEESVDVGRPIEITRPTYQMRKQIVDSCRLLNLCTAILFSAASQAILPSR